MDTLTIRAEPSQPDSTRIAPSTESDEASGGVLYALQHPVVAFQRLFHIEFDLDGCLLCDDDSLHADLVALFERSNAPTARPEA